MVKLGKSRGQLGLSDEEFKEVEREFRTQDDLFLSLIRCVVNF